MELLLLTGNSMHLILQLQLPLPKSLFTLSESVWWWWVKTSTLIAHPTKIFCRLHCLTLQSTAFGIMGHLSDPPDLFTSPRTALLSQHCFGNRITYLWIYLSCPNHHLLMLFCQIVSLPSCECCCYLMFEIFIHFTKFWRGEFWLHDLGYIFYSLGITFCYLQNGNK